MESLSHTTLLIAGLLSLERIFYAVVCHYPKQISKLSPSGQEPEMIFKFVHLFKLVQVVAFSLWYLPRFGLDLPPTLPDLPSMALAAYLLVFGQVLNACVWHQIGIEGVCYGVKFGRKIPWCTQFPYSVMNDPQYFGAIMTVWGLFLLTSGAVASPVEWITIPVIETILYAVSMKVEY